jgi:ribonuclease HIII
MDIIDKARDTIEKFIGLLKSEDLYVEGIEQKQYNFESSVTRGKEKVKLQVYFGKKGIKTIIQGNQESDLYKLVNSIIFEQQVIPFRDSIQDEPDNYIGTDEAGKGDIFGPLVVAGFYYDQSIRNTLESIGVRDSKELSDFQIKQIAGKLKKLFKGRYDIVFISPEKYNELYSKFNNLNKLLNWAHSKCAANLLETSDAGIVITDKFSKLELNITSGKIRQKYTLEQTPKAERFLGVAAASILARDSFLSWFVRQTETAVNLPKGASDKAEAVLAKLIKDGGKESLTKIAKMHFKSIGKVL